LKASPTVQEHFDIGEIPTRAIAPGTPEAWIENALHTVSPAHEPQVRNFLDDLTSVGASPHTRIAYLTAIRTLERFDKPYSELTKEDLKTLVKWLDANRAPSTANLYRIQIKRFLKWIHGDKGYPECANWIRPRRMRKNFGKQILSEEDIKKLIEVAETQRNRALLFVLYDSGCRAGEICGAKVGDIKVDKFGAVIRVDGKTGERRIRLIESVPDLQIWLSMHPMQKDSKAPMWPNSQNARRGIDRRTLDTIIRKLTKKAGIGGQVSAHTFRHSRATHLATILKEVQMREFFGWAKNSDMPSIYVHLSGRDVDETLFEHYGIKPKKKGPKESPLAPRKCPRCQLENSASARFCQRCSAVLDLTTAIKLETDRKDADEIMEIVMQEVVKRVPGVLEEIIKENKLADRIKQVSGGE